MTVLSRGARTRRGGRRPGWVLLTVLLVLAILASSALVFTNRVELLKLAVILALWAAVAAAFVSVIYRRQSDADQAKVRDLKLVYDLQLDREISARREYELTVETQLRRELASELRAQSADEVAALRAELAALRTNLEILFDTELNHRPAIEGERTTVRAFADWARDPETTGRVSDFPLDADDPDPRTEESPIIDVPAEPQPPEPDWAPTPPGGAHRRASETESAVNGRRQRPDQTRGQRRRAEGTPPPPPPQSPREAAQRWAAPPPQTPAPPANEPAPTPQAAPEAEPVAQAQPEPVSQPEAEPVSQPEAEPRMPWLPPQEPPQPPRQPEQQPEPPQPTEPPQPHRFTAPEPPPRREPGDPQWRPAPAEGQWIPAGVPGSNWTSPVVGSSTDAASSEYVGRRRAPEPTMSTPAPEPRRAKHSAASDGPDPARSGPTLAAEPAQPPPPPEPEPESAEESAARRHRSLEDTGGQSVADLLARMGTAPSGGGRRRRREE
jgi:hypothetical protein